MNRLLMTALPCLLIAAGCGNRPPELNLTFAIGGGDLEAEGPVEPLIDSQIGGRTSIGLTAPVREGGASESGFRLGGQIALSGYREDLSDRSVAGEPLLQIDEFVSLGVFALQGVASYRAVFGEPLYEGAFFLEPGFATGPALAVLSFGSELEFGNQILGSDVEETETEFGWTAAPFFRLGYMRDQIRIGLEGGYAWTFAEFDGNLGSNPTEWYAGLFIGVQLGR